MADFLRMRKMSDTMTEGVVASWLVKVGDKIKPGDILAEVETDKATMEFETFETGVILHIIANPGESVAIDAPIAIFGAAGEDFSALLSQASAKPEAETKAEPAKEAAKPVVEVVAEPKPVAAPVIQNAVANAPVLETSEDGRLKASPLAKRLAAEKGIDIQNIHGSGEQGRIVKRDIDYFKPGNIPANGSSVAESAKSVQLPQIIAEESYTEVNVSQMRKVIAARLAESKFTAPHFYLSISIDMDNAMKARESLNKISDVKISYNDLVVKAAASALRRHPKINSSWLGDKVRTNNHIHIGVAMAVEDGLLVPVVRFADNKSLSHIAAEVKEFSQKAKAKKLQPTDWAGNTFTISNLGMFGIDEFTAIINPPDACIMAVGGISQVPVVKNGQIVVGNVMKITLSCDHRVVDGASGAEFLNTFKSFLENPVTMLA